MSAAAVFRAETMDSLRDQLGDHGGDLVSELIALFLVQGRGLVDEIEAARATSDPVRLTAAAHKLKGSTATLGGDRLAAVCQRIEALSPAETAVDAAPLQVRHEFEQLVAELSRYRVSLSGEPRRTEAR